MKKKRSNCSGNIPGSIHLPGSLTCFCLIYVFLCSFFIFNAMAYEEILSPGHLPARSGETENIQKQPEKAKLLSHFAEAIENMPGLNEILTPLIRYWMPSFGPGGDHMTSVKGGKETLPQGTVNEGILYYVNVGPGENTIPLYRLLSVGSDMDHMASNTVEVVGYQAESLLGYPFASSEEAMVPITEMVKGDPIDHLTSFYGEIQEGYTEIGILGYGYRRHGENDGEGKKHNPVLSQIAYNGVTVNADLS
jgi:hypothetical protein